MKGSGRLQEALDAVGARLKRSKKHLVYELPSGQNLVVAKSPGDRRAEDNALADLRAIADVPTERRKAPADVRAERRRRPGRHGADQSRWGLPAEANPLAAALRDTGLIEQQLRCRIGQLEADVEYRDKKIADLEALWVVRVWRRLKGRDS